MVVSRHAPSPLVVSVAPVVRSIIIIIVSYAPSHPSPPHHLVPARLTIVIRITIIAVGIVIIVVIVVVIIVVVVITITISITTAIHRAEGSSGFAATFGSISSAICSTREQ